MYGNAPWMGTLRHVKNVNPVFQSIPFKSKKYPESLINFLEKCLIFIQSDLSITCKHIINKYDKFSCDRAEIIIT